MTALLALPALVFATARWDRRGQHFHSLFQFLLMGLNGAFLTGDLFNLFVFFEVLLAASYGLALHGSGPLRVRAGLHYIAINLAASLLFLIGVSLIYGVTGTLNMADLAARVPLVPAAERPLLAAGAAVLGVAFLVKAAMWPLCFWLPITYMAAAPPAAAMFAVLSKVGVYVVLRLSSLAFGTAAAQMTGLGAELLVAGGLATAGLRHHRRARLAGARPARRLRGAGFLGHAPRRRRHDRPRRRRPAGRRRALLSRRLDPRPERALPDGRPDRARAGCHRGDADGHRRSLRPRRRRVRRRGPGASVPACPAPRRCSASASPPAPCVIAGLPPLAGFLGKFAMLSAALGSGGLAAGGVAPVALVFTGLVVFSGLAALVALSREGIRTFWASDEDEMPAVPLIEIAPVVLLLALTAAMAVKAGPVMRYMEATASALDHPHVYVRGVLGAAPAEPREDGG